MKRTSLRNPPTPVLTAVRQDNECKAILLATARITVDDRHGAPHPVRVLIDQGSEVSLISEALIQRLRLPRGNLEHLRHKAIAKQSELRQLSMVGGFSLKKWAANHSEILVGIPADHCLADSRSWEYEGHATLGLQWHSVDDIFAFSIQGCTIENFTKRKVLSETARLFDPLGWLTPVVIRAKIFLQSAWLQKLGCPAPSSRPAIGVIS